MYITKKNVLINFGSQTISERRPISLQCINICLYESRLPSSFINTNYETNMLPHIHVSHNLKHMIKLHANSTYEKCMRSIISSNIEYKVNIKGL